MQKHPGIILTSGMSLSWKGVQGGWMNWGATQNSEKPKTGELLTDPRLPVCLDLWKLCVQPSCICTLWTGWHMESPRSESSSLISGSPLACSRETLNGCASSSASGSWSSLQGSLITLKNMRAAQHWGATPQVFQALADMWWDLPKTEHPAMPDLEHPEWQEAQFWGSGIKFSDPTVQLN